MTGTNAGTLEEITSNVAVTGGNKIAGIAGNNTKDGVIKDCHNTGAVTGESYAAGIVAYNEGSVTGCSNTAVITAEAPLQEVSRRLRPTQRVKRQT